MNDEKNKNAAADEPEDIGAPKQAPETEAEQPVDPGAESAWAGGAAAERVAALEAQLGEMTDRWKRAVAETENTRRRLQREKEDSVRFAAAGFAKDLLTVADNLRRALDSVEQEALDSSETLKALYDGVGLVERELLGAFERHGVARIEPLGEIFDPNRHEAMFEVPDETKPAGTVVQLLQPGYLQHDRLLRAAMVGVAKGGPPARPTGEGAEAGGDPGKPGEQVDETA